jgi:glycine hydroxymethyltransferase
VRGLRVVDLPYSPDLLDVDPDALPEFVLRERPRLLVVGGSVTLFPHDLAVLRAAADSVGAHVLYDASQCAGLIAAGLFQEPLAEGADVVTFSTYKTFGGPAGGAAVTMSEELARAVSHAAYPVLTSNYDAGRLAPLALAAAEAAEQEPPWADTSVSLAQALARALADRGRAVLGAERGFTWSHQVVLDTAHLHGGPAACAELERHGVLASACLLPVQPGDATPNGVRLGTQEIARRGATAEDAEVLAELVHTALSGADRAVTEPLRREVLRRLEVDIWGRTRSTELSSAAAR